MYNYSTTNTTEFQCSVGLLYYDEAGSWTINVSIRDNAGVYSQNISTSLTYNLLHSWTINDTTLNWASVSTSDTNITEDNSPLWINNTGNDEGLTINLTAYNIKGYTTPTDIIFAANFSIGTASTGCFPSGTSTVLANTTNTLLSGATLNRGSDITGIEQLYTCLTGINSDLSSQVYNTTHASWLLETDT